MYGFLTIWFSSHSLSKWGESQSTASPTVSFQVTYIKLVLCSAHPLDKETQKHKLSTSKTAQLPIFWSQITPGESKPWHHLLKAHWVCPQVQCPVLWAQLSVQHSSAHCSHCMQVLPVVAASSWFLEKEGVWGLFHKRMKVQENRAPLVALLCLSGRQ